MNKSIMNNGSWWKNKRFKGSHEHHIFGGANRTNSDNDGLVVYLLPIMHTGQDGVHNNRVRDLQLKKEAQKTWMEHYKKTEKDFIKRYKKSWLEVEE